MVKRTYEEFAEIAKDCEANEIVEHLKKMGDGLYDKIISNPKILRDVKEVRVRTDRQLYQAFKYFLTQWTFKLGNKAEEGNFWATTMEYLILPDRSRVPFLPRAAFLDLFEDSMLCAYQGMKKKCGWDIAIAGKAKGLDPIYSPPCRVANYDISHPKYLDDMSLATCATAQREREDALQAAEFAQARKIRYMEAILAKTSDMSRAKC